MKVDCHIHSLHSDGVYTLDKIIPMLLENEVEVFSLTDHDTVSGIEEARALNQGRMKFVSGIEFTCREMKPDKVSEAFSIHLLGYNFNEDEPRLLEALEKRKQRVTEVFEALCSQLTALGYSVLKDEIPISCGNVLQLCDVAACIDLKYPGAPKQVFDMIDGFSARLDSANMSVEEAMGLIHGAGGKAVWAHPFHVYKDFKKMRIGQTDVLAALKYMKKMGLDGLEAGYLAFPSEEREWLYQIAADRQMLCTAGSDFHGSKNRSSMGAEIDF